MIIQFRMSEVKNLPEYFKSAGTLIFAGLAMTFSNPFDLVRIRMQTMPEMMELGQLKKSYKGIVDCLSRTISQEGPRAFWKGNGAHLLRFYSSETINFFSKQTIKQQIRATSFLAGHSKFSLNFLSGMCGSWFTLALLYPVEYARNMLARNTTNTKKTISGCIMETAKNKGITQLYRGSFISFIGVAIFRGTYFGVFDTFKKKKHSNLERWGLAYIASILAILFTYPSDTIRRRLMCCSKSKYTIKYSGFFDCSFKIYSKEGLRSFYRGSPIIFFQSLSAACVLFSYDKLASDLKKLSA